MNDEQQVERKKVSLLVPALIAFAGLLALGILQSNHKETPQPRSASAYDGSRPIQEMRVKTNSSGEPNTAGSNIVRKWSGNGTKTTESFTATSPWKLRWSFRITDPNGYGLFQVFVYDANGRMVDLVGNVSSSAEDVSYVHRSGTFYLQVNAMGAWDIEIE